MDTRVTGDMSCPVTRDMSCPGQGGNRKQLPIPFNSKRLTIDHLKRLAIYIYIQLQEGLLHGLMQAPAVSGEQNYHVLCLAARNEEKRILKLQRRQQYQRILSSTLPESLKKRTLELPKGKTSGVVLQQATGQQKCFLCHNQGHIAPDCTKNGLLQKTFTTLEDLKDR